MIHIAIVEDNPDLLDEVCFVLRHEGFDVTACKHGAALDLALDQHTFDVIVLDIGLPGEDGFSIARRLRQSYPSTGIVMMTARGSLDDRILGMEEGADAYLTKPVDLRELALVIQALARRLSLAEPPATTLILCVRYQTLQLLDGTTVGLTRSETLLLSCFAQAPEQQATRQQLIEALGQRYLDYDPRRLEAIVSRLRKKLVKAGFAEDAIRVMRQTGYYFSPPIAEPER